MLLSLQAWLNNQQAVVGTKCNKLLLLNLDRRGAPELPALQEIVLPKPVDRNIRDSLRPNAVQSALWGVSMLLRSTQRRPGRFNA